MSPPHRPSLWWVRRDLRLADNPALSAAVADGSAVLPLFVLDPLLLDGAKGSGRRDWLMASLRRLDADLRAGGGPGLSVVEGRPVEVVPRVAAQVEASAVHIAADFAPYGRRRDAAVQQALTAADRALVATGSPYGVAPGTLVKSDATPFQVFSPYHRAWLAHGVHQPAAAIDVGATTWMSAPDRVTPEDPDPDLLEVVGETAAAARWQGWLDRDHDGVQDYARMRNFPAVDGTSRLSRALRWGHLHPRTVLADLAARQSKGASSLAREISWRDFFADVLWHRPEAVRVPVKPEFARMRFDDPTTVTAQERLEGWRQGRTGYPLVDAGMRQLLTEHWMHN
ncbi:MAG: deoxyribodipyrimidine photo-lyase, partial [Actinomycetes bacterium]